MPRALLNLLNHGPVLPRRVVVARIKLAGGGQVRGRLWKLPGMERRAGQTDVGAHVVRVAFEQVGVVFEIVAAHVIQQRLVDALRRGGIARRCKVSTICFTRFCASAKLNRENGALCPGR